jgi:hypothetical protein
MYLISKGKRRAICRECRALHAVKDCPVCGPHGCATSTSITDTPTLRDEFLFIYLQARVLVSKVPRARDDLSLRVTAAFRAAFMPSNTAAIS